MMSTISKNYFENAQLSLASYAILERGMTREIKHGCPK